MNPSAALIGKNARDDITSSSNNLAPTERQQFLWRLRTLHSNEPHCAVPKSSFTWSVFAIRPCNQLHKYPSNELGNWLFYLYQSSGYVRTRSLLCCIVTIVSLSSQITQLSNSYRHVRFTIFEHRIARGYDLFQKYTCLYSWFEGPYFTNHLWSLVGINEFRLEAAYCLE